MSKKLRTWRAQHRYTITEVADLSGLSVATVSRAERGERRLSPEAKVALARAMGVRVADLFDPEADTEPAT